MIVPHDVFQIITPDQVAECWDGVYQNELVPDLYEQLWDTVKRYGTIDKEDIGPHDVIGVNAVARFWGTFSEPAKHELNRLAALNER